MTSPDAPDEGIRLLSTPGGKSSSRLSIDDQPDWYTSVFEIASMVERARALSASRVAHAAPFRRSQIRAVLRLVEERGDDLAEAIASDLSQGPMYSYLFEIGQVESFARHALENLDEWMASRRVPTMYPLNLNVPTHSEIRPYPRGVVLILPPWNFPIQLTLFPLLDALAAGNVCVLKQSERSVHVTKLLTRLLAEYLDPRAVVIVNGGVDQATELLRHRFDAISYTGGVEVAKIVAAAAAKNLTPTLLELGGKNPAIICDDADIKSAALRIAWGKISGNAGQMCVAPDYVLVSEKSKRELVHALKSAFRQFYTDHPKSSPDVGRMISVEHTKRVAGMLDGTCTVLHGGEVDVKDRFIAPTIVEATADSTIMQSEIFGPVLAIVTVPDGADGAVRFVNSRFTSVGEHPLSLYVFSKSEEIQRKVLDNIPSGMACVNDVVKQCGNIFLPFGGVGTSGMGAYRGKYGFDFFSHQRGILVTNNFSTSKLDPAVWLLFPPYNSNKLRAFRLASTIPPIARRLQRMLKIAAPVILAMICYINPGTLDAILEFNLKMLIDLLVQVFSNGKR